VSIIIIINTNFI